MQISGCYQSHSSMTCCCRSSQDIERFLGAFLPIPHRNHFALISASLNEETAVILEGMFCSKSGIYSQGSEASV
jgi:hypothetical protein